MANFKKMLQPLNFVKIIVLLILVLIIYNIYSNSYEQQIAKIRKDKDHYFRTSINSPILEKEKFEGLNYYAPDKKFKVVATLKTFTSLEEISITNSDGRKTQYVKYANATFLLNDESHAGTFDAMWKAANISGITGHRSVGGYRASMYNAMPIESVQVLVDVMRELERAV